MGTLYKVILIGLCTAFSSLSASADECSYPNVSFEEEAITPSAKLTSLLAQLRQMGSFSLPYVQTKRIAVLTKPLVSSGIFSLREGKEIEFKQERPFPQRVIVKADELVREAEGKRESVDMRSLPQGSKMTVALLSLFSSDAPRMLELFSIGISQREKRSLVLLTPKDPELKRYLNTLSMTASKRIEKIVVCESNGDSTVIEFSEK